jgi:crossover junction endodeoxyribonuclease RuvC
MIILGIDPGITGAVAAIDRAGWPQIYDLPTTPLPGAGLVRRRIDGRALIEILRALVPPGEVAQVHVEQVGAMGGKNNATQTVFSLGRTLGAIEALCEAARWPIAMVQPKAWKEFYGLGKDKGAALELARRLYPDAPLPRMKDHNRAEALLIAHRARQLHLGATSAEGAF